MFAAEPRQYHVILWLAGRRGGGGEFGEFNKTDIYKMELT
jgi:hypothetical protein